MVSGKVQVLEVPYETPYIRDTSPLVSFVPTLTSVQTWCGQVLIITTNWGAELLRSAAELGLQGLRALADDAVREHLCSTSPGSYCLV